MSPPRPSFPLTSSFQCTDRFAELILKILFHLSPHSLFRISRVSRVSRHLHTLSHTHFLHLPRPPGVDPIFPPALLRKLHSKLYKTMFGTKNVRQATDGEGWNAAWGPKTVEMLLETHLWGEPDREEKRVREAVQPGE